MLFKNKKSRVTTFEVKCDILADLWMNHRDDEDFKEFCEYNDLGLPLSYLLANGIVATTDAATEFVNETFALLLKGLEIEDTGFESLAQMIGEEEAPQDETPASTLGGSKFCANCGVRYELGSEKFCANCGSARL
jgi:hypothetical protein